MLFLLVNQYHKENVINSAISTSYIIQKSIKSFSLLFEISSPNSMKQQSNCSILSVKMAICLFIFSYLSSLSSNLINDFLQQQYQMNTSNAFSDYMVTYSVNRSINLSPTSGKLHKQRQKGSYGPTICLMNRSRAKQQESTVIESKQQPLLQKIFLLSMEIERLNESIRTLRLQKEEKNSGQKLRQISYLKQQNQRMKSSLVRYQSKQFEVERNSKSQVLELKQKLSMSQAENRTLGRKLKQYEREIQELHIKKKVNDSLIERTKMEASRMEMSMHFNSTNIDLHKSVVKQKAMQIQSWRQKVVRCQDIINDQKYLINNHKEELNKERQRAIELENKHQTELDFMRKQVEFSQREITQNGQQQSKRYNTQLQNLQKKIYDNEQQFKDKCMIIANQVKTISTHQQTILQLQRKLSEMEFNCHSKVIRAEESVKLINKQKQRQTKKASKQIQRYIDQIQSLKIVIQQYKIALNQKEGQLQKGNLQMNNKLKQKQHQVKRLSRRAREPQSQTKINHSLSVDNSIVTNKLRSSQVNLENIFSSVLQMKNSNDRSQRLIGKSYSTVKEIYYAN